VLELQRRLLDHLIRGEDRGVRAHRKRERVRRPGIDLDLGRLNAQGDQREEGVVPEFGHGDACDLRVQLAHDVRQQIVRHRARRLDALKFHQDGRGLGVANPDGQELIARDRLEQDDRLLSDHVEAHSVDAHLLHGASLGSDGPEPDTRLMIMPVAYGNPHPRAAAESWPSRSPIAKLGGVARGRLAQSVRAHL
jgi:hypothetical protein